MYKKELFLLNIGLFLRAVLLLTPVTLLFYQENGLTTKELFFFGGIFYLISILIELPIGYFADIFPKKNILIVAFIAYLVNITLWLNFQGYFIVLLGEILFAIFKVSVDTASSGYIYEYLQTRNEEILMPKYWGYTNFFLSIGTAIAASIGTFLYANYGSHKLLLVQFVLIFIGLLLILFLKKIPAGRKKKRGFFRKYIDFRICLKYVLKNEKIKYYMFYSGLLTSMSILFAMSFQPIMQKAMFPIAFFGVISTTNFGVRALSSIITGKLLNNFNLYKLRIPLYFLYTLAFCMIFYLYQSKNLVINLTLLITICLIIGGQLIFTILHLSRVHKLVNSKYRGFSVAVNNLIPKFLTVIMFLSSHFFITTQNFLIFYKICFGFFIISGFYLLLKTNTIKE